MMSQAVKASSMVSIRQVEVWVVQCYADTKMGFMSSFMWNFTMLDNNLRFVSLIGIVLPKNCDCSPEWQM